MAAIFFSFKPALNIYNNQCVICTHWYPALHGVVNTPLNCHNGTAPGNNNRRIFVLTKHNDMPTKIFVNLAVKDLEKTKNFFDKLGFTFNKQFTDDKAACMIINDDAAVMLLSVPFFKSFTPKQKEVADASSSTEVMIALSADSKDRVHEMMNIALSAGATEAREPQDYGFMFGRSFNDLDGHVWEIIWMDPNARPQQ